MQKNPQPTPSHYFSPPKNPSDPPPIDPSWPVFYSNNGETTVCHSSPTCQTFSFSSEVHFCCLARASAVGPLPGEVRCIVGFLCHLLFRPLFPQEAGLVGVRRCVNRTPQDLASPLLVFLFPSLILAAVWGPGCTAVLITPACGGPPSSRSVSHLGSWFQVQSWPALLCQAYTEPRLCRTTEHVGMVHPASCPWAALACTCCPQGPSQQEEGGKPRVELSFLRCVEFALLLLFFKYIYRELIR